MKLIRSNYQSCEHKLLWFKGINSSVVTVQWDICFWWAAEEFTSEKRCKVWRGDARIWFVARSTFLTDHWNIPAQITRWITAILLRDMLDTLFCYLSFNRQLIALLSVRCLRSTVHSVTHSPDLIVFLMAEASVARHWRNDASQVVSRN